MITILLIIELAILAYFTVYVVKGMKELRRSEKDLDESIKELRGHKKYLDEKKRNWNAFVDTIPLDMREQFGFKKIN